MEQKQDKALFPGQQKGIIKLFIKRDQQDQYVQSHFHFFVEENFSSTKPKPKVSLVQKNVNEGDSEQLCFNLFDNH